MNKLIISTLFLQIIFGSNQISFSKESLFCHINLELENNIPAKKKKYEVNKLELFFDFKNEWINDIPKKKWLQLEKDNLDKINITFLKNKTIYKLLYERYYSSKKQNIELSYEVTFDEKTGLMSFPKYYFNNEGKSFFSTELRGVCK